MENGSGKEASGSVPVVRGRFNLGVATPGSSYDASSPESPSSSTASRILLPGQCSLQAHLKMVPPFSLSPHPPRPSLLLVLVSAGNAATWSHILDKAWYKQGGG
ncbi:hypothetical protein GOP47_0002878 [Adiantum capillus-veneris]|uniref:Uncharacterized protein n=1 Tax=Adiantum capillus-veneris TaxID=13818 RepID=A0A9D4VBS0_ADICA|nr:hypothetical protein GOP47_0002878 [Adiantum capillus-veneris]